MQIVCHKQYIQTVSLRNDFACVLSSLYYFYSILPHSVHLYLPV